MSGNTNRKVNRKVDGPLLFGVCVLCLAAAVFVKNLRANYDGAKGLARYVLSAGGGMQELESGYASSFWKRESFINWNGRIAKLLGLRSYFKDSGIYVTRDMWIVSGYPETSTDYELEQMVGFRDFLAGNGIRLLYVNEPVKYIDDSVFENEFGLQSFSNRNLDRFLARLGDAGIPYVDLRAELRADGLDVKQLFYRTDHHWTVPAGLWAAGKIAGALNRWCSYSIDMDLYDGDRFAVREWKSCWLGEQGRKISASYVGLDDYAELKPTFETSFSFKTAGEEA